MLYLFSYLEVIQIYFTVDTNTVLEIFSPAIKQKKKITQYVLIIINITQLFLSAAKEEITNKKSSLNGTNLGILMVLGRLIDHNLKEYFLRNSWRY